MIKIRSLTNKFGALFGVLYEMRLRFIALFLLNFFWASILFAPLSAAAEMYKEAESATNQNLPIEDYPRALKPNSIDERKWNDPRVKDKLPKNEKPKDAQVLAQLEKKAKTSSEPLQSVNLKPTVKPHEVTSKRTATSSVSVNADGSMTQKNYFTPKFFQRDGNWKTIDTTLIEDKNAGDADNKFGKAFGAAKSWVSKENHFVEDSKR
jgi:hypothetical protein